MANLFPTRALRSPATRGAAILIVSLGLLLGACGGDKKAAPEREASEAPTTSTTSVNQKYIASFATAKNRTLTVYTTPPTGVTTTTEANAATTTTRANVAAIPRSNLNSAGVKKTAEGMEFTNPTYNNNPLVVEVLANQGEWLQVDVVDRPNTRTGWVRASDVVLGSTDFRIEIDLSTFRLRVYKAADLFFETTVAVGKDSTPTPLGHYFMAEIIKNPSDTGVYGAYILPTSGYSETLDSFDGGLPQIALHGTNQPGLLGSKASNGCIRMSNEAVTKLATTLPAGTPIEIFATTPPTWS